LLVHCFNPFRAYNLAGTKKCSDYIISSTLYPLTVLHDSSDEGNAGTSSLLPVGSGDKAVSHFVLVTSGELGITLFLRKMIVTEGNQLPLRDHSAQSIPLLIAPPRGKFNAINIMVGKM